MYEQQLLGYNYRLTDIHAALGLSQLKRLDKFVLQRNEKFNNYKILLKDIEFIKFLNLEKNVYSSYHLAVIVLDEKINKLQEKILLKRIRDWCSDSLYSYSLSTILLKTCRRLPKC